MMNALWDLLTQILVFLESQYFAKETVPCIQECNQGSLGVGTDWELGETILAWNMD